jgi:hypothetical protein
LTIDSSHATTPRRGSMFWLLLAATLSLDATAMIWVAVDNDRATAATLYEALCVSQISLLCVWSMLGADRRMWAPLIPIAAAALVVLAFGHFDALRWTDAAAEKGVHVAGLMALLWILRRTPWWQRGCAPSAREKWQFSLGKLLIVMTVVAVLIVFLRHADETRAIWNVILGPVVYGSILLPVIAVVVWRSMPRALLRLAATLLAAAAIAAWPIFLAREYWLSTLAFFVIQALVLWLWLEWGGILKRPLTGAPAVG